MAWGCEEGAAAAGGNRLVSDYAGLPGTRIELAPADLPDDPPIQISLGEEAWEARLGEDWDVAASVGLWEMTLNREGLTVAGVELLDDSIPDSASVTTWYGKFTDAITVKVKEAPFAGEWSFARDLGPIVITLDEARRECVVYERDVEEDTGG